MAVRLLRGAPGTDTGRHGHHGMEYTLVLRGGYTDATGSYGPGDFQMASAELRHNPVADPGEDCINLSVTTGRLNFDNALQKIVARLSASDPRLARPARRDTHRPGTKAGGAMLRYGMIAAAMLLPLAADAAAPEERWSAPGLSQPVEILKDRWGISHIYAQNEQDLFFAQGYNAARDRLFQLEVWRRQATAPWRKYWDPGS